ncbi:hypothetical protein OF83DRAFT_1275845 [Amylostereum chailletii]|nr:hypothetical protein OF83DRAFT_1275845 [Amylostereum chailletii]
MTTIDSRSRDVFRKFKEFCVPLLEHSLLSPANIPRVLVLLENLHSVLQDLQTSDYHVPPSIVSYAIFPLTTILRKNQPSAIPDRVLELLVRSLHLLCENWWWDCDLATWEQLFVFCGAVIGDLEGKGKSKARDDETKEAAVQCLISLTRPRGQNEDPRGPSVPPRAETTLSIFRDHSQLPKFIPILGQTLNSLLTCTNHAHRPLQRASLHALGILLRFYAQDDFIPTILPGTVSTMTKLSLGTTLSKGWTNGDIVAKALAVMEDVIIKSVGNDPCMRAGLVHEITDLDDLTDLAGEVVGVQMPVEPYFIVRTTSWLRATTSQLLIALNSLTPLVAHPTSSALIGLSSLSSSIILSTSLTLSSAQPLLASFLLSLSLSSFDSVSHQARRSLEDLLGPTSKVRHVLLSTLLQITKDNLSAIPRLMLSRSDAKISHVTRQIEAICLLAVSRQRDSSGHTSFATVSSGIGKFLGPTGGIEKWGWRLLSVLEFETPSITVTGAPLGQLSLEGAANNLTHFPDISIVHVSTRSTQSSLETMLHALGNAGGEDALFAVEWFTRVGCSRRDTRGVAALWCACHLLQGISGIRLDFSSIEVGGRHRQLEKVARGLARNLADLWDDVNEDMQPTSCGPDDEPPDTAHRARPDFRRKSSWRSHRTSISLRLLSVSAGILQARFPQLLLHTLYPVLHSIVSPIAHLSLSGLAALDFISSSASYASPSNLNLLLSNFDYALDAVSRRLSREWLDVDAMKVLVLLVRLVGPDVVHKAGDVVEECFDRLDEYHGYATVVDGLVEVLGEVVKVIEGSAESHVARNPSPPPSPSIPPTCMKSFAEWYRGRNESALPPETDQNYGPTPRQDWATLDENATREKPNESDHLPIDEEIPPTAIQSLTKQIVSRSIYFLTHQSTLVRARILTLLVSAAPVLPDTALLSSIHHAWPFILNRLSDVESFVVVAAAALIEALSHHVGSFMYRRIWDDVWPIFRSSLKELEIADSQSALARRGKSGVGTESAYTYSHRLHRSIIKTMTVAAKHVHPQDSLVWEVLLAFRRFLHKEVHEELQACARELYMAVATDNEDAVWLALGSTTPKADNEVSFLRKKDWDINQNLYHILDR